MPTILGIESTAHTFGVAVVKNGKILSNCKKVFTTEKGGMIPMDVAKFHNENKNEVYFEALKNAGMNELAPKGGSQRGTRTSLKPRNFSGEKFTEGKIDAIAFSQGPGLAPCLLVGMKFAKEISRKLKIPLVPVNHCIAHLEIGTHQVGPEEGCPPKHFSKKCLQGATPVMLYVSGANTQIIAYSSGKYRIFGETLDLGVGNFIDSFGRYAGIGFPAGPMIEKLATKGKSYIELPYKVKGMDIALSGILTNLRQKLGTLRVYTKEVREPLRGPDKSSEKISTKDKSYSLSDLAYSMQETVFAMLVETAERALAHTGKNELLLGGGVACNSRLQEMCKIMCKERGAKLFVPDKPLLVDNAGMIAYLGEIIFNSGIKYSYKNLDNIDIKPRQRTDEVDVSWK